MPGFDVEADPGRPKFPAFTPERKPDLTLFLKNAVAEELDYFKAQEKDFRLYGFAVEYYSLAPKLVVVYNSDRRINDLLDSADEATDPARNLGSMKLTLDIIRKACLRPPVRIQMLLMLLMLPKIQAGVPRQNWSCYSRSSST